MHLTWDLTIYHLAELQSNLRHHLIEHMTSSVRSAKKEDCFGGAEEVQIHGPMRTDHQRLKPAMLDHTGHLTVILTCLITSPPKLCPTNTSGRVA